MAVEAHQGANQLNRKHSAAFSPSWALTKLPSRLVWDHATQPSQCVEVFRKFNPCQNSKSTVVRLSTFFFAQIHSSDHLVSATMKNFTTKGQGRNNHSFLQQPSNVFIETNTVFFRTVSDRLSVRIQYGPLAPAYEKFTLTLRHRDQSFLTFLCLSKIILWEWGPPTPKKLWLLCCQARPRHRAARSRKEQLTPLGLTLDCCHHLLWRPNSGTCTGHREISLNCFLVHSCVSCEEKFHLKIGRNKLNHPVL